MPKDEEEECKQEYVASLSVCESGDNISLYHTNGNK